MLWLVPLVTAAVGTAGLAVVMVRVRRELAPTSTVLDAFGRDLRPAVVAVRDETARARARRERGR